LKKREKKKANPSYLSAQAAQQPTSPSSRRSTPSLSFSFSLLPLMAGSHDQLPPSPFLSSSPLLRRHAAAAVIPAVSLFFPLLLEQAN
jgi:hypothetical protein